jgi:hypothetical protein
VNSAVTGVESVTTNVLGDVNIAKQKEILFVCNRDAKEFPTSVFRFLRDCLRSGKRVLLVVVGDVDHRLFSNLMVLFGAYDIYHIPDESMLNERFVRGVASRRSGIEDVAQFVGCDTVAYGLLDMVLLELAAKADDFDIEDIDADALIGAAETVTYLKAVDAEFNYREKDDIITNLTIKIEKMTDETAEIQRETAVLKDNLENTNQRLAVARARVVELENTKSETVVQVGRGAMTVQPVCNVDALTLAGTKHILYFKEISQVPYINTCIKFLVEFIRSKKVSGRRLVCKLLIFDFYGTSALYAPLLAVTGEEYMQRRIEFSGSRMEMVVLSPQMAVLSDVVTGKHTGEDGIPDVVVVYDRTRQLSDIVCGKNVTKFFVCQSKAQLERSAADYRITDPTRVITRSDVFIHEGQLDIPRIENYGEFESESRRSRAYMGLHTRYENKPLFETILNLAGVGVVENGNT